MQGLEYFEKKQKKKKINVIRVESQWPSAGIILHSDVVNIFFALPGHQQPWYWIFSITGHSFPQRRISATCAIPVPRNDGKCKCVFVVHQNIFNTTRVNHMINLLRYTQCFCLQSIFMPFNPLPCDWIPLVFCLPYSNCHCPSCGLVTYRNHMGVRSLMVKSRET